MSASEFFNIAVAIASIPGILFTYFQIRDYLRPTLPKADQPKTIDRAPSEQSERVLLTFDRQNLSVPGTWEYTVGKFWDRLPPSYGKYLMHPRGLKYQLDSDKMLPSVMLLMFGGLLIVFTIALLTQTPSTRYADKWNIVTDSAIFAVNALAVLFAIRLYMKWWRVESVLNEFEEWFDKNEIDISPQITQSKRKHVADRENATAGGSTRQ